MQPCDLEEVVDLAALMYSGSLFKDVVPPTRETLRETLEGCLANGTILVEKVDNEVVGFLAALLINSHPIVGPCRMAAELGFYVKEGYRSHRVGHRLFNNFEVWCKNSGVTHSMASAMFNEHFEGVKNLYERNGYKMVEASFIKQLSDDNKEIN